MNTVKHLVAAIRPSRPFGTSSRRGAGVDEPVALNDCPRLLFRSAYQRTQWLRRSLPASSIKVTVTGPAQIDPAAGRRFVGDGRFPFHLRRRAVVVEAGGIGDVVLMMLAVSSQGAASGGFA